MTPGNYTCLYIIIFFNMSRDKKKYFTTFTISHYNPVIANNQYYSLPNKQTQPKLRLSHRTIRHIFKPNVQQKKNQTTTTTFTIIPRHLSRTLAAITGAGVVHVCVHNYVFPCLRRQQALVVNNTKKAAPKKHLPEILTVTLARPPLPFFGGRCVTRHTHFISGLMDVCLCPVVCWVLFVCLFFRLCGIASFANVKGEGWGWGRGALLSRWGLECGALSDSLLSHFFFVFR